MSRRSSIDPTETDYYIVGKQKGKGRADLADERASRPSEPTTPDRATHGHSQGHASNIPPQQSEDPASNDPRTVTSNHDEAVYQQRQSLSESKALPQTTISRRSSIDPTEADYYVVGNGKGKGRAHLADERAIRPSEPTTPDRATHGYSQAHLSNIPPKQPEDPASNDSRTVTSNHDEAVHQHQQSITDTVNTARPIKPVKTAPSHTSSVDSTPPKVRGVSTEHTRASEDDDLGKDIEAHLHTGITVRDFLKIAFDETQESFDKLLKEIKSWGIDKTDEYQKEKDKFARFKDEKDMYEPFANMGNMFLKHEKAKALVDGNAGEVRLHHMREKTLRNAFATRKPDIVLIPKVVKDRVDEQAKEAAKEVGVNSKQTPAKSVPEKGSANVLKKGIDVLEVLFSCEFKKTKKSIDVKLFEGKLFETKPVIRNKRPSSQMSQDDLLESPSSSSNHSQSPRSTGASGLAHSADESSNAQNLAEAEDLFSPGRAHSVDEVAMQRVAGTGSNKRIKSDSAAANRPGGSLAYLKKATGGAKLLPPKKDRDPTGRVQLASYAVEQMSARGDRSYTFGIRVVDEKVSLCFYHRSAIVEAEPFSLLDDPQYLAFFLLMFQRDPKSIGFNAAMGYCNPFNISNEETKKLGAKLTQIEDETNEYLSEKIHFDEMKLGEMIAPQYCLIGRGTSVFRASIRGLKKELAVKFCWQVKSRKLEIEFLLKARELIPDNIPEIFGHAEVEDDTPVARLVAMCTQKDHEGRQFRILVLEYYESLDSIEDDDLFWELMMQCTDCLHFIYKEIDLLHRDISIGNLAFRKLPDGRYIIIILDFDLAAFAVASSNASQRRTGTAPFMARGVLDAAYPEAQYVHDITHDLESVYYVLVWRGLGYGNKKKGPPKEDWLESWRKGSFSTMRKAKQEFITTLNPELLEYVKVKRLQRHLLYIHKQYFDESERIRAELNKAEAELMAEAEKEAGDAKARALKQGHSDDDAEKLFDETFFNIIRGPKKPMRSAFETRAISYKRWMLAAGADFGTRNYGCRCC